MKKETEKVVEDKGWKRRKRGKTGEMERKGWGWGRKERKKKKKRAERGMRGSV